jgi:hypothetical protein
MIKISPALERVDRTLVSYPPRACSIQYQLSTRASARRFVKLTNRKLKIVKHSKKIKIGGVVFVLNVLLSSIPCLYAASRAEMRGEAREALNELYSTTPAARYLSVYIVGNCARRPRDRVSHRDCDYKPGRQLLSVRPFQRFTKPAGQSDDLTNGSGPSVNS